MCEVTLGGEGGSTRGMFLSFYCQMSNQIVAIRDTVKPTVHMSQMLYAGQSAREIVTFLSDF